MSDTAPGSDLDLLVESVTNVTEEDLALARNFRPSDDAADDAVADRVVRFPVRGEPARAGAARAAADPAANGDDAGGDFVENDGDVDFGGEEQGRRREDRAAELIRDNEYLKCLGFRDQTYFFYNRAAAMIIPLVPGKMNDRHLLSVAPLDFWRKVWSGDGGVPAWDRIINLLYRGCEKAGYWSSRDEIMQGAVMDAGVPVFHTGSHACVDGNILPLGEVTVNDLVYTTGKKCKTPDFENAYEADAPDVRAFLNIIRQLGWRDERRDVSVMSLFGYVAIAPICGVLEWRPHVWLDGQRGVGKSWVLDRVVRTALGDFHETVKSNSTEPGLRSMLHARAVPLLFDEAEGGSSVSDKNRFAQVMSLARHTSSESDAVVAQGAPGGSGVKFYTIKSMFFLASITTSLESSADRSRFARLSLGEGLRGKDFIEKVERPMEEIVSNGFSRRLLARMVSRAGDAAAIIEKMTAGLLCGDAAIIRRVADLYAVFAAGAWMALRDGVPADEHEAFDFIEKEFGAVTEILRINEDTAGDTDHDSVLSLILAHKLRIETANGPAVTETVAALIRNVLDRDGEELPLASGDVERALSDLGVKFSLGGRLRPEGAQADGVIFDKKSQAIRAVLADTGYQAGYADLLRQFKGASLAKDPIRFRNGDVDRGVIIPRKVFVD
ncbi:MAG: hypothetical protein DI629_20555 [Mesorhizobium amorphae]|nr:MAG: hypothetical protein DI629_20555 [Mesorhizobium amorphae]